MRSENKLIGLVVKCTISYIFTKLSIDCNLLNMSKYLLGYDVGSSSVKASILDAATGQVVSSAHSPSEEMSMLAIQPGWAEQDPSAWWEHAVRSLQAALKKGNIKGDEIAAIGISYQMHGLVCIDKNQEVLRPSIIWCDSRAVEIGKTAFHELGENYCLQHLLNSPGNFTASKLRWVKIFEPEIFERVHQVMLPGDYLAMKFTGEVATTRSGLSEGMFWDYSASEVSKKLLDYYGLPAGVIAPQVETFSIQGAVKKDIAAQLGL